MRKLLIVAFTGIALAVGAHGAFAQDDQDNDVAPSPGPASEMRSEQLNEQMREMTGRIEELQHTVDVLRARLDKMATDYDARLQALEQQGGGAPGGSSGQTAANGAAPVLTPPPPRNRNNNQRPAPDQQATTGSSPPAPDAGTLPNGSPQQQYDYAFGLLRDANYAAAERALRDFVHRYPDNRLASNAQYWLGETYYVRRNFQAAAAAFAEGYQRYPKGPKAPDALLKLGSSLTMLNRRADACRSFSQLDRDFPIAPANLKAKEAEEKRRAGCR